MKTIETCKTRRGFTMVELLIVITIIVMLAGMSLSAMAKARERSKLDATKATVAKINDLVMKRYASYGARRMPYSTSGSYDVRSNLLIRMVSLRCLMQMEMPDRWTDITNPPLPSLYLNNTPNAETMRRTALSQIYYAKYNANKANLNPDHQQAKCLYLWVTTAMPEAKALFRGEEIRDVDGDGWKCFVDGWGNPIGFLRWAPGASAWSDIQVADATNHHDPFDPILLQSGPNGYAASVGMTTPAYQLYPLIFAGVLGKVNGVDDYGIVLGNGVLSGDSKTTPQSLPDPFLAPFNGNPAFGAILPNGGVPLVTNHHMEAK
jgi:prepilin-type N-terminal cleavage/methylation domain-containing protein